jgi:hypothetical protein
VPVYKELLLSCWYVPQPGRSLQCLLLLLVIDLKIMAPPSRLQTQCAKNFKTHQSLVVLAERHDNHTIGLLKQVRYCNMDVFYVNQVASVQHETAMFKRND